MRATLLSLLLLLVVAQSLWAQPFDDASDEVFAGDVLPTVQITIDPLDLDRILAPENAQSDVEYLARFEFESPYVSAVFDSVGFRLRGNTSRLAQKKSFRVSFNTFIAGGDWKGLEKLNLNGEHNDPSIVRSRLSWELFAGMGVPSSRAAHVRLYINGEYFGLYINVEHVDEEFLKRRFGNDEGFLYKCLWPADLTPGSIGACDVQLGADENAAYDDLAGFINTVNVGSAGSIERALDVNGFLRYLAVTVVTGSWDSYWFLKNNFYLYEDPAIGKFRMIPYDYDNTFGIWWEGIWPGLDWSTRNVYDWGHPIEDRPLADRILAIPEFRERYTLYLKQILAEGFSPESLKSRALALRDMTSLAAEEDRYSTLQYGFTIDDYHDSYFVALADRNDGQGHVRHGLLPFIDARHASALAQLDAGNIAPVISEVRASPSPARPSDPVEVFARVEDEGSPTVEVSYWPDEPVEHVVAAVPAPELGPDMYRAVVPALGFQGALDIRVGARDDAGATRTGSLVTVIVNDTRPSLYLNEFMALNESTQSDEFGEFDDWIELYNAGDGAASIAGMSLSDDFTDPTRWTLPDVTVPAGGYLVLWLDGTPDQGALHAPFRLSGDGEELGLFDTDATPLDRVTFGPQTADIAFGRSVDGAGSWGAQVEPTPGAANAGTTGVEPSVPVELEVRAWPNPFRDALRIHADGAARIRVFDLLGRPVATLDAAGSGTIEWDGRDASGRPVAPGAYFVRVDTGSAETGAILSVMRIR